MQPSNDCVDSSVVDLAPGTARKEERDANLILRGRAGQLVVQITQNIAG